MASWQIQLPYYYRTYLMMYCGCAGVDIFSSTKASATEQSLVVGLQDSS